MLKYVVKLIAIGIIMLFMLTAAIFFHLRTMPDESSSLAAEKNVSPAAPKYISGAYGLDKPAWEGYWKYLENILSGDFGISCN